MRSSKKCKKALYFLVYAAGAWQSMVQKYHHCFPLVEPGITSSDAERLLSTAFTSEDAHSPTLCRQCTRHRQRYANPTYCGIIGSDTQPVGILH